MDLEVVVEPESHAVGYALTEGSTVVERPAFKTSDCICEAFRMVGMAQGKGSEAQRLSRTDSLGYHFYQRKNLGIVLEGEIALEQVHMA